LVDIPDEPPCARGLPVLRARLQPRHSGTGQRRAPPRSTADDLLNDLDDPDTATGIEDQDRPMSILGPMASFLPMPPPLSPPRIPVQGREHKIILQKRPFRPQDNDTEYSEYYGVSAPVMAMTDFLADISMAETTRREDASSRRPMVTASSAGDDPPSFVVPASVYFPSVL
jgi:hypothetical protein